MNRMFQFVVGAFLAVFVTSVASEKCRAEEIGDTNSLRVVVVPSKSDVRVREHFKLALRVENPTSTNQYVRVMSCSWPQEWQTSNPSIVSVGFACTANAPISLKIPAGGAITFDLEVLVPGPISIEPVTSKLSFQMGFTPLDRKKTFWSNEVSINISPAT